MSAKILSIFSGTPTRLLQPILRFVGGESKLAGRGLGYVHHPDRLSGGLIGGLSGGVKRVIGHLAATACDWEKKNRPPWHRNGLMLSAPAMAVVATSVGNSDSESDDDSEEGGREVTAPKGKHLWCLEDSYGYTKGI